MRKFKLWLVGAALVGCLALLTAAYDTINTLPSGNATFISDSQTFWEKEAADRDFQRFGGGVVSGCIDSGASGLAHTVTACVAYPEGNYVSQSAVSHTYTATKNTFVYVRANSSTAVTAAGFTITYDGYFVFLEASTSTDQPVTPSGVVPLMKVVSDGSSLTTTDLRVGTAALAQFANWNTAVAETHQLTLYVTERWVLSGSPTAVPTNITLDFTKGGMLSDGGESSTVNLTINGKLKAGLGKIFDWDGGGAITLGAGSVKEVYPQWWGALGDGSTDDTGEIQAAVDSLPTGIANGGVVFFPPPSASYLISSTIVVPAYVSLIGAAPNIRIQPDTGGSWSNNYVFYLNTTEGYECVVQYAVGIIGSIKNIYIFNTGGDATTKGFLVAGNYEFDHVSGRNLANLLTTTNDYIDGLKLSSITTWDAQGTTYQIKINQLGDNLLVSNIQFGGDPGATIYGLYVKGCWGGIVQNLIGGTHHYFEDTRAFTLANWHVEGGRIVIKNANIYLKDMYLRYRSDVTLEFQSTDDGRYFAGLENVLFDHRLDDVITGDGHYDIQIANQYHIAIDNVFKLTTKGGRYDIAQFQGVFLLKEDGSEFTDFNRDSAWLSKHSEIIDNQELLFDYVTTKRGGGGLFLTDPIATSTLVSWQIASDTYYYRAQFLSDVDRMAGKTESNENNIALTNDGQGMAIVLSVSNFHRHNTLRLYRGTTTGSYDKYVDIPIIITRIIWDDGNNVNGFAWKSRTAGGVDTISGIYRARKTADDFTGYGIAIPVGGSWTRGDVIYDNTPVVGGNTGWICTESGTFGSATDSTGDTDGSTAVITGMADTADFAVGSYVDVTAGFPSTGPYKILSKTATTITLDTNSDSSESNITVDTSDPVFMQLGITQTITTTLTTSQVNNLRGTRIELVPAQGTNTIIEFVSALLSYNYTGAAFTVGGDEDFVIQYDGSTAVTGSIESVAFIDQTNDEVRLILLTWTETAEIQGQSNKKLEIVNTGSGETADGGTSTIIVNVTYRVHATGL